MKKFLLKTSLAIAALLTSIFTSAEASEMNSDFTVDSIAYAVLSHEPATVTVVWCFKQNLGSIHTLAHVFYRLAIVNHY